MAALTEEQLNRYEAFRRAALARPKMKRVSAAWLCARPAVCHPVSPSTVICHKGMDCQPDLAMSLDCFLLGLIHAAAMIISCLPQRLTLHAWLLAVLRAQFVSALLGVQVSDKTVIALCGIGKMFVGDLIEMGEWKGCHASPRLRAM